MFYHQRLIDILTRVRPGLQVYIRLLFCRHHKRCLRCCRDMMQKFLAHKRRTVDRILLHLHRIVRGKLCGFCRILTIKRQDLLLDRWLLRHEPLLTALPIGLDDIAIANPVSTRPGTQIHKDLGCTVRLIAWIFTAYPLVIYSIISVDIRFAPWMRIRYIAIVRQKNRIFRCTQTIPDTSADLRRIVIRFKNMHRNSILNAHRPYQFLPFIIRYFIFITIWIKRCLFRRRAIIRRTLIAVTMEIHLIQRADFVIRFDKHGINIRLSLFDGNFLRRRKELIAPPAAIRIKQWMIDLPPIRRCKIDILFMSAPLRAINSKALLDGKLFAIG